MGAEFGLDSDEDLQIDERLGKEKASLIIRSSMFLFYFSLSCHFPFGLGLNLLVFWFTRLYILSYFFLALEIYFSVNSSPLRIICWWSLLQRKLYSFI